MGTQLMIKRVFMKKPLILPLRNSGSLARTEIAQNANALRPNIHATFALSEVVKAHQMMEAGTHFGKIVLRVAA